MYEIFLEKNVVKFLSKAPQKDVKRIAKKLDLLQENPFPSDVKKIINIQSDAYRVRVGIYRILYRIEDNKIIIIFVIDKRSRAYRF